MSIFWEGKKVLSTKMVEENANEKLLGRLEVECTDGATFVRIIVSPKEFEKGKEVREDENVSEGSVAAPPAETSGASAVTVSTNVPAAGVTDTTLPPAVA